MKRIFLLFTSVALISCQTTDEPINDPGIEIEASSKIYAIDLSDQQDPNSSYDNYVLNEEEIGKAHFTQSGNVVTVEIELFNQKPNGIQAVHIHNGSIETPLRHWNQNSPYAFCNEKSMGRIWAKPFAGDIGNIPVNEHGYGYLKVQTDLWALNSGDHKDILDKILIVHQKSENFLDGCSSSHAHDISNPKIGGGKIELLSDVKRKTAPVVGVFPDFTICD